MVTNVAIIGYGIVGKATHEVLLDHINVEIHDPEKGHKCDYKSADVVFICTPYEHVGNYINDLKSHKRTYIRSTIPLDWVVDSDIAVWSRISHRENMANRRKQPIMFSMWWFILST